MNITKEMREAVAQQVRQNAFAEERAALHRRSDELCRAYRVAVLGGPERAARFDAVAQEFPELVELRSHVNPVRRGNVTLHSSEPLPWPPLYRSTWADLETGPLQDIDAHELALRTLESRLVDLLVRTDHALRTCRTVARAREQFPEFAQLFPDESKNLPAVLYTDVRDALCTAGVITCDESTPSQDSAAAGGEVKAS